MISQEQLKNLFGYCPDTGVFIRKVQTCNRVRKGDVAGSLHPLGYLTIRIGRKNYYAHRLAWFYVYGKWPQQVDHINHDKADNRLCNLRNVTDVENRKNQTLRTDNSSGVCGVAWDKHYSKWKAHIGTNRKPKTLGYFDDVFDAICVRKSAEARFGFHQNPGSSL